MSLIDEYKLLKAAQTVNNNNFFNNIENIIEVYENYYQEHIKIIAEKDAYIKELEARLNKSENKSKEEKTE